MNKKRGTGVYLHSQGYKGSTHSGATKSIPETVLTDFRYDPLTGFIRWADPDGHKTRKRTPLGNIRAKNDKHKKLSITYKGSTYALHRVAYFMYHGHCPPVIDHIDGDTFNNRIANLRPADPTLNLWNQGKRINNTTGITGVVWHKATEQWRSRINVKGVTHELGFTDDKFEAACLRKSAELKMFGTFRRGA